MNPTIQSPDAWMNFKHDEFLNNPEPEPNFAFSAEDPPVHIPPDNIVHDMEVSSLAQRPWHLTQPSVADWETIWDRVRDYIGGVTVAILDTGVNPHEMLPTPEFIGSWIDGQSGNDGNGHGTHCAGIAVGNDRRHGVAPGARLWSGKCLSNGGGGPSTAIEASIRAAVDWRGPEGLMVDVISLSLGGNRRHPGTVNAINYAFSQGTWCNAAAGNSGPREATEGWPARDPDVPSIGAMRQNGEVATFSSRGSILVACPGEFIVSASHRGPTLEAVMSGTSMACPFKAGVDALSIALRRASGLPNWRDNTPIMELYKKYAIDQGDPGYDSASGFGVIDYSKYLHDMAYRGKDIFDGI